MIFCMLCSRRDKKAESFAGIGFLWYTFFMEMKSNSIEKKITSGFLSCMLICGLLACLVGLRETYRGEQEANHDYLFSCAGLIAETVGRVPVRSLAGDSEGEAYRACRRKMDTIREEMGLKYVYIYIPAADGESLTVIAVSGMRAEEAWSPGQVVEESVPSGVLDVYAGKEESAWTISRNRHGYVVTVYRPVYDAQGKVQAVAGADLERRDIARDFFKEMGWLWTLILLGCAAAFFLLRYLTRKLVIAPVVDLSRHMGDFVEARRQGGGFSEIQVTGTDEISQMARAFNQMAEDLGYYVDQVTAMAAAVERERTEMETARRIQRTSLPNGEDPYPDDTRFSLWASMTAAKEVGGDFYDYFWISEDRLCTVIGDVSGKGIGAALFMMRAMTLIRERAVRGERLSEILEKVNDELCSRNGEGMFVTLFIGILDAGSGQYRYACAGHNPPYVGCAPLEVESSLPLGLFEEETFREDEIWMRPGDTVFLYTDGVTEAVDAKQTFFGEQRMEKVLGSPSAQTSRGLAEAMQQAIGAFAGDMEQSDDITMLVLKYIGQKEE